MAADGTEAYPGVEDRIVAEFGDGYDVSVIASRYGLTVDQVYAVVHREVGHADQPYPPPEYPPPTDPWPATPPPDYNTPTYAPPSYGPSGYSPSVYSPSAYGPQGYAGPEHGYEPPQGLPDDVIVADYGAGHDVEAIARKHGISVDRVYEIVQRVLGDNP
ncbi:hypothetical protein GCM10010435_49880 [Winogradskya consettensis]|uniref:Uncharacterized protein n=1 Tax=Winogradskya consettensis TaxID=113560 RepID=A0A919VV20_9ACTN|nr:helix-turn-helix domain-containing protein [Actinoplanes consettensis]GIM80079.1 hypothetical protein Aco04nite_68790 [Actinoplanes consettensis]